MQQLQRNHEITHWYLTTDFRTSNFEGETDPVGQADREYHTVAKWVHDRLPLEKNKQWCGTLGFTHALTRGMLRFPDAEAVYVCNGKANLTNMDAKMLAPLRNAAPEDIPARLDKYYIDWKHQLHQRCGSQS